MASTNVIAAPHMANAFHKRSGDLRLLGYNTGVWTRAYANHTTFDDILPTKINSVSVEAGIDHNVFHFEGGRWVVGIGAGVNVAKTIVDTESTIDGGGESLMPYVGLYSSWMYNNGLYIDTIARYARNSTDAYYYDGIDVKHEFDMDSDLFGASMEMGYRWKLDDKWMIEPRIELAYANISGSNFTDDVGFTGSFGDSESLLGTVGTLVRYRVNKRFVPYLKLSYVGEFAGKTDVAYDGWNGTANISGNRIEAGIGATGRVKRGMGIYGEAVYQRGDNGFQNINLNLGMRYSF